MTESFPPEGSFYADTAHTGNFAMNIRGNF